MRNSQEQKVVRTISFSIIGNSVLAVLKWVTGYFGNSYALVADAIESVVDVVSSFLVLFGLKYAHRPADKTHPYGHGRIEPLITFFVVGLLIVSAVMIAAESIHNIRTPHELPKAWTLFVLGGIILWKEVSFQLVIKKSKETGSSSLKADAWHHRSDAITSVAAFIGISIARILGEGYENADDFAALFASGFILYNCYRIFRPALGEMMDENIHPEMIAIVREKSLLVEGILATEKCFVRKTGTTYHVDLHAIVDPDMSVRQGHELAHRLKDFLLEQIPELENVLIHIEPYNPHKKRTAGKKASR